MHQIMEDARQIRENITDYVEKVAFGLGDLRRQLPNKLPFLEPQEIPGEADPRPATPFTPPRPPTPKTPEVYWNYKVPYGQEENDEFHQVYAGRTVKVKKVWKRYFPQGGNPCYIAKVIHPESKLATTIVCDEKLTDPAADADLFDLPGQANSDDSDVEMAAPVDISKPAADHEPKFQLPEATRDDVNDLTIAISGLRRRRLLRNRLTRALNEL